MLDVQTRGVGCEESFAPKTRGGAPKSSITLFSCHIPFFLCKTSYGPVSPGGSSEIYAILDGISLRDDGQHIPTGLPQVAESRATWHSSRVLQAPAALSDRAFSEQYQTSSRCDFRSGQHRQRHCR